jgi:hypothetical protein
MTSERCPLRQSYTEKQASESLLMAEYVIKCVNDMMKDIA